MTNSVQNLSVTTKYLSDEPRKHVSSLNNVADVMDDPFADEFQKNLRNKDNDKMCYNMKKQCFSSYKKSNNVEEYKKCMLRYQTECQKKKLIF